MMSWISTYPADVVKTRMQADYLYPAGGKSRYTYSGFWECCRQLYRQEGWSIFGRGIMAALIRAFPANAAVFWGHHVGMKLLNGADRPPTVTSKTAA